jgi:hypothetical protein
MKIKMISTNFGLINFAFFCWIVKHEAKIIINYNIHSIYI